MVVKLLLFGKCTVNCRIVRNRTNSTIYDFEKKFGSSLCILRVKKLNKFFTADDFDYGTLCGQFFSLENLGGLAAFAADMESRGDIFLALLSLFFQMIFFNHDWGNANFFFSKVIPVFGSYRNILVIQVMKICDFLIFFYK